MIKVHFYDYGCGELDVEKELGITEEADVFLTEQIPGLEFEGNDSVSDLEDNLILWFSADNEENCVQKIHDILNSHISGQSRMQYAVQITSGFYWND